MALQTYTPASALVKMPQKEDLEGKSYEDVKKAFLELKVAGDRTELKNDAQEWMRNQGILRDIRRRYRQYESVLNAENFLTEKIKDEINIISEVADLYVRAIERFLTQGYSMIDAKEKAAKIARVHYNVLMSDHEDEYPTELFENSKRAARVKTLAGTKKASGSAIVRED